MANNQNNEKNEKTKQFYDFLKYTIVLFAIFILINFLLTKYLIVKCSVSGISMQPTFENQERVIANRNSKLKRNEIVILKAPDERNSFYIKRIIGLPGETVTGKNNKIYVNGKKINQDYLKPGFKLTDNEDGFYGTKYSYTADFSIRSLARTKEYKSIYSPSQLKEMKSTNKVPKGSYFVMGDHRSVSKDSRYIGAIPRSKIEGVVKYRYWPLNRMKAY